MCVCGQGDGEREREVKHREAGGGGGGRGERCTEPRFKSLDRTFSAPSVGNGRRAHRPRPRRARAVEGVRGHGSPASARGRRGKAAPGDRSRRGGLLATAGSLVAHGFAPHRPGKPPATPSHPILFHHFLRRGRRRRARRPALRRCARWKRSEPPLSSNSAPPTARRGRGLRRATGSARLPWRRPESARNDSSIATASLAWRNSSCARKSRDG